MDWGKVKFFLGEVLRNFTRNAGMQATAIGTVAMTIVLLGCFIFIRGTLTGLGDEVLNQIEVSVYLAYDITPQQTRDLREAIARDPRVRSVQFISKRQGLAELRAHTNGVIDTSLLTQNPLPDKLRVRVRQPQETSAVAATIRKMHGVQDVVYPQTVVERLLQLGGVLRRIGIVVISIFLFVAGIIISNTIRLTVFARRREISIMQLVGATNMYIRLPFICEGLLAGVLGSLLAVAVLAVSKYELWPKLLLALPWVQLNAGTVDLPTLVAELVFVGGAIGVVASWISVGRYLRT
ncbi:MAG: permease-like cell division protein FtsX [Vulcanimicrobiaceae bacterium]